MAIDPIEAILLSSYPNPRRLGCPGADVLRAMVQRPLPIDDPLSVHLWHCSPCFGEFRILRNSLRAKERLLFFKKSAVAAAATIAVIAPIRYFTLKKPSEYREVASQVRPIGVLNYHAPGQLRGIGKSELRTQVLSASIHDVLVILADGTAVGPYEVELRSNSGIAMRRASGKASKDRDGLNKLRITLDLAGLPTGEYTLAWRADGALLWDVGSFVLQ